MLGAPEAVVAGKLDEAYALMAKAADSGNDCPIGAHYGTALLAVQTAICHTEAGQPRRGAELYEKWLQTKRFSQRDYGYFLSLKASALALSGEPDEASSTALAALPLARNTNSTRTIQELNKVVLALRPWQNRVAVRELREAMTA
jgi:tetratricopeptide (TPR) repeat protein